jgi:2-polyprenyl-6-methoxyphenol hydroxylase-like FAD-dependent oxidoreductase
MPLQRLTQRISIVGAGVPGLAAAHALHQAGFKHVQIFEAAPSFAQASALHRSGVVLAANGVRILDRLDLATPLYTQGNPIHLVSHLSHAGHKMSSYSPSALMGQRCRNVPPLQGEQQMPQLTHIAIAGDRLYDALTSTLPRAIDVHFNASLSGVERKSFGIKTENKKDDSDELDDELAAAADDGSDSGLQLRFGDGGGGPKVDADLLLADDGLRSRVREEFMGTECRGKGVAALDGIYVRGISPGKAVQAAGYATDTLHEVWGTGCKLAFAPLTRSDAGEDGEGDVMWLATVSSKLARTLPASPADSSFLPFLGRVFHNLPTSCVALLASSLPESVKVSPIEELLPASLLHDGGGGTKRIVLLGSGAHAPVQEHWQGVAQGLEDAAVLVSLLSRLERSKALETYSRLRVPRALHVCRAAHDECAQALQGGKVMSAFRDMASSMMPPAVARDLAANLVAFDAQHEADNILG